MPQALTPLLQLQDIHFGWPGQPPLFNGLSCAVPPGVTWVGGDESTGKTTLLRLMTGDIAPLRGMVRVEGSVYWVNPRDDGADALTPSQCFDRVAAKHPALDRTLLADLVRALDLSPHLAKQLHMLSTGSRRKVWLAAGLASGAAVTLLDQPFAAVDKASMRVLTQWLQDAAQDPVCAVVVADYETPQDVVLAASIQLDT